MLFRQLFDPVSSTYTYLLASKKGGEALIIDPVIEQVSYYLALLRSLRLQLVIAVDTHTHADHVTGLSALRCATGCATMLSERSPAPGSTLRFGDGDMLEADGVKLRAVFTPGHTSDSYCFLMPDRVFTGDTLLIRSTGRTDLQEGNAFAGYDSLFNKLLKLPDRTKVYPGHSYDGRTHTTIGEERRFNPHLQVNSPEEFANLMSQQNLPPPKMMTYAMPANMKLGERRSVPRTH